MTLYDPATERLDPINESLSLIQIKKGLTFGTDSYLLSAFAKPSPAGTCVELGGGTGVVSLLMAARRKFARIHSVEIQPPYASLIGRNAALNGLSDVIRSVCADVRDVQPSDFGGEANAVVSNPPYMRQNCGFDNAAPDMNAARREENGTIDDFVAAAARLLRYGGTFSVVYRPDRMAELFSSLRANRLEPKRLILVYPTAADKPCLILCEAKKGAAPSLAVSRPLIIYRDKAAGVYTDDMQAVYDNFTLEHLF